MIMIVITPLLLAHKVIHTHTHTHTNVQDCVRSKQPELIAQLRERGKRDPQAQTAIDRVVNR